MAQELQFIELASGDWFYIIEDRDAPRDAWDWHEYATAHGPFPTLEAAQDHEYNSDSDTSGAEIVEFTGAIEASAQKLLPTE
jgi:hypothetical protein